MKIQKSVRDVGYRVTSVKGLEMLKGPPDKILWDLLIIPRFKRLFSIKKDASNLRWHADRVKKGRLLIHPADSLQSGRLLIGCIRHLGMKIVI